MTTKRLIALVLIAAGVVLFCASVGGAVPEEAETGLIMLSVVLAVVGLEMGAFGFFTKRTSTGDSAPGGPGPSPEPPKPRLTDSDRALIETGPTHLSAAQACRFADLREAWDAAHWELFDEMGLVDERGAIDHSDPDSYRPFAVTTDEESACRDFFDALTPEQRFELLALANYSRYLQSSDDGWAEAVQRTRADWDRNAAGHGHFPAGGDAAVERFIAFVPDLEILRSAVGALERKGLIR